jgi:excisionase family DNA binding protein
MQDLLTLEELAKKLKVGKSWIYARTRETGPASIPRINCGKYLRFEEHEVERWLRKKNGDRS